MPAGLGALPYALAWFGSSLAAGVGITLTGFAISVGVGAAAFAVLGYGVKRALNIADPADYARNSSYQTSVRGTQEPRLIVYGQARVGGIDRKSVV